MRIHEYLDAADGQITCRKCGEVLGPVDRNYKLGALRLDRPVTDANPYMGDVTRFVDADVTFRQYVCPGCGVLFDNEIARVDDPPIWDIQVQSKIAAIS
jgi:N-methylhydantoinase B